MGGIIILRIFVIVLAVSPAFAGLTAGPNGNATIRGKFRDSEIVIRTTNRLAGAIDSLQWNGKEFIDSFDHGRQLQSAASFDLARPGEFWAECFNPTEAGSRADGVGNKSTSRLLDLEVKEGELRTKSQMAFWLAPGEKSEGRPALNTKSLSDHLLRKQVRIGRGSLANVIEYDVTFTVPTDEHHRFAQFEALTGYMPAEFSRFRRLNPKSGELFDVDDGPGEQEFPLVFATPDGKYAMGVYSPEQPSKGYEKAGYGRFRFKAERVVKWNCVFRFRNASGIVAGDYRFQVFVAVGTLEDVREALTKLISEFSSR